MHYILNTLRWWRVRGALLWLEKSHWLFPYTMYNFSLPVCVSLRSICAHTHTLLPRCIIMQVGEPRGDYVLNCINFFLFVLFAVFLSVCSVRVRFSQAVL